MGKGQQKVLRTAVRKALDAAYDGAECIPLCPADRYVFMSDCHRGVGNWGDNFQPNQNLFFSALQYYFRRGYTYVELGDGDELWENRSLHDIIQMHSNQFWLMSEFYRQGRFYMLYGNHDRQKAKKSFVENHCEEYYQEAADCNHSLFPGMEVREGLILEDTVTGSRLFLVHGHQGDFINDRAWRLGRFLVRHVWRRLELAGVKDPTSAAKNYRKKKRLEQEMAEWAAGRLLIMAGHTHRPVLPAPGEGCYLNDGSCVHPRCITAIELSGRELSLVKWSVHVREDQLMYVGREVLAGPYSLSEYFN